LIPFGLFRAVRSGKCEASLTQIASILPRVAMRKPGATFRDLAQGRFKFGPIDAVGRHDGLGERIGQNLLKTRFARTANHE
jgi:hypothetical protein